MVPMQLETWTTRNPDPRSDSIDYTSQRIDHQCMVSPHRADINRTPEGASPRSPIFSLPEMLFDQNRVSLHHEASGVAIELSAKEALRAWREADSGTPLQVSVAQVSGWP